MRRFRKGWIFVIFVGGGTGGGGHKRQKWKRILEKKNRIGVGRTVVSTRLDYIVVCAVSSGHDPKNPWKGFAEPWIFMILFRGSKVNKKQKHENAQRTLSELGRAK